MKYIFLLTILLSCKSGQRKIIVTHPNKDTTTQLTVKHDTSSIDIHDPYETGKDTVKLNAIMDKIFTFPEVQAINKQINKNSKGTRGVSIMVHDEFNDDTSYYHFMVGDNSQGDRFMNVYDFLLDKKTGQLKVYNSALDTIISLQGWRKSEK
jgi:hypothetical protein